MPIFDSREKNIPILPSIIITNVLPLVGIIYFGFSFFALFYLYWWETVLISIVQWIKMGRAEKVSDPDPGYTVNGKMLTHQQVNSKRYMRRSYFWIRTFMLGFYLIFIVVFVGLLGSTGDGELLSFIRALFFLDTWMIVSFGAIILTHVLEYIAWVKNGEYKITSLRELGMPFDARIIIMHIVIVLGTFGSMYASESLFPESPLAGMIAYASIFVLLKTGLDIFSYYKNQKRFDVIDAAAVLRKK